MGGHDPVVSSSSAFALGVRPDPGALHVCYCHNPFRYAWFERDRALAEAPRITRPLLDRTLGRIRVWDRKAASGVTRFVANSAITQARIEEIYGGDYACWVTSGRQVIWQTGQRNGSNGQEPPG